MALPFLVKFFLITLPEVLHLILEYRYTESDTKTELGREIVFNISKTIFSA